MSGYTSHIYFPHPRSISFPFHLYAKKLKFVCCSCEMVIKQMPIKSNRYNFTVPYLHNAPHTHTHTHTDKHTRTSRISNTNSIRQKPLRIDSIIYIILLININVSISGISLICICNCIYVYLSIRV